MSTVSQAVEKIIAFYDGGVHDIEHFLKVYALAKTIGEQEGLDAKTQETLELAAIVHDIACPLCREKYGNTAGKHQELESPPLVSPFLAELNVAETQIRRIDWLVAHHHTYTGVDGLDHRILLEADFLVNAGETPMPGSALRAARERVFQTQTGKRLLDAMFLGKT